MQKYEIEHKNVMKILASLEELPYKHVKYIIPFFEASLVQVKEGKDAAPQNIQEEGRTKKGSEEEA